MKQKRRRFEKSLSSIWSSARSGFSKTSWLVAGSYPSCEYQGAASALVDRRFFAVLYTPFFRTQSTSARFVTRNCAILERAVWEKVQEKLVGQTIRSGASSAKCDASPLAGKLFDERGERLTPSHATKNGRRYRYYVSTNLANGRTTAKDSNGWRFPAQETESSVFSSVRKILEDRTAILEAIQSAEVAPRRIPSIFETVTAFSRKQESGADPSNRIAQLVDRVELRQDGIQLSIRFPLQSGEDTAPKVLHFKRFIPLQVKRRGVEMRLVIAGGFESSHKTGPALFKAVARAHRWFEEIVLGSNVSFAEIAKRERINSRYVRRLLPLAFLDPGIVEAIAEG